MVTYDSSEPATEPATDTTEEEENVRQTENPLSHPGQVSSPAVRTTTVSLYHAWAQLKGCYQ